MASKQSAKPLPSHLLAKINAWQKTSWLALPLAVHKKYSDDEAGYQAALIAYYGFLSLFPLLIVGTALIQIVSKDNTELQSLFIENISSYFPALGDTIAESIVNPAGTGIAVLIGLLLTFYGARGVADAVQHALHHAWAVPRYKRSGFPKAQARSLSMILFAGTGLLLAATATSIATSSNRHVGLRFMLWLLGFIILFVVFWGVFTYGSSAKKRPASNIYGAVFAAIGFTILQSFGSYIVTNQLRSQTGLNAQFGAVLALLFWMYLQSSVLMYAIELSTVKARKLWPRSLLKDEPTYADKKAYALYAEKERFSADVDLRN